MKKNRSIKVIPLGGMGEIGRNITLFQYEDAILIVDAGLSFPSEEMLGVDIVVPDITYLIRNAEKIKGLVITHGHEDHIGAISYLLKNVHIPVIYGTPLALGFVRNKLKESKLQANCQDVKAGDKVKLGPFGVEFIQTTHSIPDCVALAISTPLGMIVHTGDFKIDPTPVDGRHFDLMRFAQLGRENVILLISDSTNVEKEGVTASEKLVGKALEEAMGKAPGRVLVTTFASNIHRIQQAIDAAIKSDRKVAVAGRSMRNNIATALKLGYLSHPEGAMVPIEVIGKFPPQKVAILTTGSQGEPMSVLNRIAEGTHKNIKVIPGDTVILSAKAIPGNERLVSTVIDKLFKAGASVMYGGSEKLHVSGHASQEELKLVINMVKPKHFMPCHGEYRMLILHGKLAASLGIPPENIFIMHDGDVLEMSHEFAAVVEQVEAGKVMLDASTDLQDVVLKDRQDLAREGLVIVAIPVDRRAGVLMGAAELSTMGFVKAEDEVTLMGEARGIAEHAVDRALQSGTNNLAAIQAAVKEDLSRFLYNKTRRTPIICPFVLDIM